jgi:hypothetical protein
MFIFKSNILFSENGVRGSIVSASYNLTKEAAVTPDDVISIFERLNVEGRRMHHWMRLAQLLRGGWQERGRGSQAMASRR